MARWWRGWRKRKHRRRAGSSVETDRQSLERAFRRLGEIAEEIAEIGRVFEAVGARRHRWSSDAGAREALTASVNRLLVPGFAAHTLAQEERRWSTLEHTTPCSSFSAERVLGSLLHPAEPPGV